MHAVGTPAPAAALTAQSALNDFLAGLDTVQTQKGKTIGEIAPSAGPAGSQAVAPLDAPATEGAQHFVSWHCKGLQITACMQQIRCSHTSIDQLCDAVTYTVDTDGKQSMHVCVCVCVCVCAEPQRRGTLFGRGRGRRTSLSLTASGLDNIDELAIR